MSCAIRFDRQEMTVMTNPHRQTICFIVLIFALGFICYANTVNGPFLFDDGDNILLNGHIRIHNLSPAALADNRREITDP